MQQAILIDKVEGSDANIEEIDVFEIEWFETQKFLFKRNTRDGLLFHLQKEKGREWTHGDLLFANDKLLAQVQIKPVLTIEFMTFEPQEVADFCYYIGNRHLPLFVNPSSQYFVVPYDGNLYEQLVVKFSHKILLLEQQLLMNNIVKKVRSQKYNTDDK